MYKPKPNFGRCYKNIILILSLVRLQRRIIRKLSVFPATILKIQKSKNQVCSLQHNLKLIPITGKGSCKIWIIFTDICTISVTQVTVYILLSSSHTVKNIYFLFYVNAPSFQECRQQLSLNVFICIKFCFRTLYLLYFLFGPILKVRVFFLKLRRNSRWHKMGKM